MQAREFAGGFRVKHWSFIQLSIDPIYIRTSRLQRSTLHGSHLWGDKKSSREATAAWVSATAKVLAAAPWSAGGKTIEPWKSVTPLERVWQMTSIWHFQAMCNAVYLAMLNKVIVDNSLAILWNVWRGRILMVEMRFGGYLRLFLFYFLIHSSSFHLYLALHTPPPTPSFQFYRGKG